MAKTYPLKTILEAANRPCNYTNKSFHFRAANAALETGLVRIVVIEEGRVWTEPSKHNVRIMAGGWMKRCYIRGTITPGEILHKIGELLLDKDVQAVLKSQVHLRSSDCAKCNGAGIIPQFSYYCNGICFDCGGTGANHKHDKTSVTINQ